MSRGIVTTGPHFFTSSAILRLLAAGSEERRMEETPGRAAEEPAAERVDAVAGSEFVDDRIRLRE
jgi:hypothetical protein